MQRLQEDRQAVSDDMKEVLAEAKGNGFDVKIIRKVLAILKMDKGKRQEMDALIDLYMTSIGET